MNASPIRAGRPVGARPVRARPVRARIVAALPWTRLGAAVGLILACLVLMLPGQFSLPPADRDEARFVQATRQMLESGDFIDIRFQGEARHKKPVGIYWLQSLSVSLLAAEDLTAIGAYRVPSWIGLTLAVLLTGWTASHLFGRQVGLLAALLLAGCVVVAVEARTAKTDAVLLAAVVAAQGALARLYLRRGESGAALAVPDAPSLSPSPTSLSPSLSPSPMPPSVGWGLPALFWTAQGVGILLKGPIVPMVSGLTVLALIVSERRAGWLAALRPLPGLALMTLIAAPWLISIAILTDGAFFSEAVGHDMLGKVASGQESHGSPPGFYLLTFWLTFAPFAGLAALAAPWAWRQRHQPAVRFSLAWIIPTWILFELVPTKLPHYTLPVFPAIAALTAAAALGGALSAPPRPDAAVRVASWWWRLWRGTGLLATVLLTFGVALVPLLVDGVWDGLSFGVAGLVAVAWGAALIQTETGRPRAAIALGLAGAMLLYGHTFGRVFPEREALWPSRLAAAAVAAHARCPTPPVTSVGYNEPSLVFLLGTQTHLAGAAGAVRFLLANEDCGLALVEARHAEAFQQALDKVERTARVLTTFQGYNYAKGQWLTLSLYRLESRP